jgi:hypothetical protein
METIVIVSFVFVLILSNIVLRRVHRYVLLNKYKSILAILEFFQDKSYNSIYEDQLIAYTSSGTTNIPIEEMETIERNFIKLTFELLGSHNTRILNDFFGGKQTVINNIVLYFRQRLAADQLSKVISQQSTQQ